MRRTRKKNRQKSLTYLFPALVIVAIFSVMLFFRNSNSVNPVQNVNSYSDLQNQLFPSSGFDTQISLGDIVPQLVQSGVIDMSKMQQLYAYALSQEQLQILTEPNNNRLVLTQSNANFMLNILWAIGIANQNPMLNTAANYSGVANLASTGGWTLANGSAMLYFDKLQLISLTPQQQTVLEEVAGNTYRPCCNNPTAFPDCNHGAALLGLLELGASQNMTADQLYTLALHANTLWFPQQYLMTAMLYKIQNKDYWGSAQEIMGRDFSSASGWQNNVYNILQKQNLLPPTQGGGSCGVSGK